MEKPSLTLARSFKAPPSRVFQAWTDPALLARWFCVDGGALLHAETTPVVGGAYSIRIRTPDGEEAVVSGVYQEIVRTGGSSSPGRGPARRIGYHV